VLTGSIDLASVAPAEITADVDGGTASVAGIDEQLDASAGASSLMTMLQ